MRQLFSNQVVFVCLYYVWTPYMVSTKTISNSIKSTIWQSCDKCRGELCSPAFLRFLFLANAVRPYRTAGYIW